MSHSNYRPRMHRLATVHARDNQPTTNDVTTQPISISASFYYKVRRLKRKTTVQLTHVLLTASLHSKCVLNQIYSICVIFVNYLSNIFVMWCQSSLSDYTIQSTLLTHHYSCADCGQNSGRRVLTILVMIVIRRGRPTHANTALIYDTT